jgi:single-strand DNA-binding protein
MINNVTLVGRLTKDADLRYTSDGTATASFSLAVNRPFKSASGEREADFINCVIWRKNAENFANFTHKGSLVGITGRIQTRNYEGKDGNRVYVTEVVADNFALLEKKSDNAQQAPRKNLSNNEQSRFDNTKTKQDVYNDFNNTRDPFTSNGNTYDIDPGDLPF